MKTYNESITIKQHIGTAMVDLALTAAVMTVWAFTLFHAANYLGV